MKKSSRQTPQKLAKPDLTLVIPAYHEALRIGKTLDTLALFLKTDSFFKQKTVDVIVVVADSPDKTRQIVAAKRALFRHFSVLTPGAHVGKGRDVRYGMLRARGAAVIFMDADLATPLHHLEKFYRCCRSGSALVIGTRDLRHYRSNPFRNFFSAFGNSLYRLTGGAPVEDTQCGFKMFSHEAAELCFSRQTLLGWGFDVELLAIAQLHKLKITAFRIDDWQDMPYSTYHDNSLKITLRTITDYVHIKRRRIGKDYL